MHLLRLATVTHVTVNNKGERCVLESSGARKDGVPGVFDNWRPDCGYTRSQRLRGFLPYHLANHDCALSRDGLRCRSNHHRCAEVNSSVH